MGAAAQPRPTAPIVEPDLLRPDAEGLRAFLWDHLRRGEYVALVTWLVTFVTRLWTLQRDLIERERRHKRRQAPSEKLATLQQTLPGLFDPPANDTPPPPKPRTKKKRGAKTRHRHGRPVLPAFLPRQDAPVAVPAKQRMCPRCAVALQARGTEDCETLERIPERYVALVTRRERLACPCCQDYTIVADLPDAIVDRGVLGEALLVGAAIDHFLDAVPYERIARNAKAQGVPLAANTLAKGAGRVIDLLDPVVRHIFQRCVQSHIVGIDATAMPVLDADLPAGIRSGALWNLLGDRRWSFFGYAPSGHDDHLDALLAGVTLDTLQCDGSATINVAERRARVRLGCHSHARSKVVVALRAGDPRAVEGLRLYAELFAIEAKSKAAGERALERLRRRQQDSRPVMDRLRAWVDARLCDVEPKSPLGEAVGYLTRQWPRLVGFLADGAAEMTNNDVERQLRTWVLDRKTWLFCGHEESARRAAAALTVLMTAKLHGLDPRAYVRDTIRRILAGTTDVTTLWPENYVPLPRDSGAVTLS